MTARPPEKEYPTRHSVIPQLLIVTLTPFISAFIGFIWASLEICLDPGSFGGDVDTWSEALQIDADYDQLFVTAFFVFGLIAGIVAAICFSFWRLAGCCGPAKPNNDA